MYGDSWPYPTKASACWKVDAFFLARFGRFPGVVCHLVSTGRDQSSTFEGEEAVSVNDAEETVYFGGFLLSKHP
jgi:hypothetical protein